MKMKALGCVLLILGTSLGVGMLALPVAMAQASVWVTLLVLLLSWALMTLGALGVLEVNLSLKPGCNLVSMAGKTLGRVGQGVTWVFYLLLLYSLLAAYLSSVGDVFQHLLCQAGLCLDRSWGTVLALGVLGSVVYCGLGSVDGLNRLLMLIKLSLVGVLVTVIFSHFSMPLLRQGHATITTSMLLVVITSYGFAIIVPSLREYMVGETVLLKKIVVLGSLLPLLIYVVWVVAIQGVLPRTGPSGLIAIGKSSHVNSLLMTQVGHAVALPWLSVAAKLFVSICVLTSFLGVSVCQIDFIADGVGLPKTGFKAVALYGLAYLPPLLLVLLWPGIFLQALSYAGLCCVVILILMPLMMVYVNRYRRGITEHAVVPGGRKVVVAGLLVGCAVLLIFVMQLMNIHFF